jgi:hypothetical protein
MENKSFTTRIEVAKPQQEVFGCITEVPRWWSTDFEGNSRSFNDEFIIHHPNTHFSKQRLVEVIPYNKIVWLVTDSNLSWLQHDKQEWTGTKMIFEISTNANNSRLDFTHQGLSPEKECYAKCAEGWKMVIEDWLFHYISTRVRRATDSSLS